MMEKYIQPQRQLDGDATQGDFNEKESGLEKDQKNLAIFYSFQFSFPPSLTKYINSLKEELKKIDLQGLENTSFIDVSNDFIKGFPGGQIVRQNSKAEDSFSGVEIALSELRRNKKVLLLGPVRDQELLTKIAPQIKRVLGNEDARYISLEATVQEMVAKLKEKGHTNVSSAELQELQNRTLAKKAAQLLHDAKYNIPKTLQEAVEYFPSLVGKSQEDIFDFLNMLGQQRPEIMKGQNIEGVYCDIEGTLFDGETLNADTLAKLKEFEQQGKTITLWTDGNIDMLKGFLDREGIKYPLKNKADFAGASAEIVIDNDDENTFAGKTKIFPKKFIKV